MEDGNVALGEPQRDDRLKDVQVLVRYGGKKTDGHL